MVTNSTNRIGAEQPTLTASQRLMLHSLVPVAMNSVTNQIEPFSARLSAALFALADQTVHHNESAISRNALDLLKKNGALFNRAVASHLSELLLREVNAIGAAKVMPTFEDDEDFSLVSLEEMEDKVLIGNLSHAIEHEHAALLMALNVRMSAVLQREEISLEQNPFRPAIFFQAVYDAWRSVDPAVASHRVVLRLLRPDVFLEFDSILSGLNDALIARGMVPNLKAAYRGRKPVSTGLQHANKGADGTLHDKLHSWLSTSSSQLAPTHSTTANLSSNANVAGSAAGHVLFGFLTEWQKKGAVGSPGAATYPVPQSAETLRQIKRQAPHGTLSVVDENTIELLAKIFDYVFREQTVADGIKGLIGQLQIPLLKAALIDKEFFFKEDHPARSLIESLAKSSVAWNREKGHDDPLYKMIERIVERVQQDCDQQIELFSNVVADLDTFIAQERKCASRELAAPIAAAMRQERMAHAQKKAESDVALRLETGEVAGFVEGFLEKQWTQVLALAYSVQATKPEGRENAIKAMDLLIWSVKPKTSPEERKELITHLPAMLSLVNAWLNVVKWDGAERVRFFSQLAERHAAIVRVPTELSPRHEFETAVTVAQRASERRFTIREKEMLVQPEDQFVHVVSGVAVDDWIEFCRANNAKVKFQLSWVSPQRTRFVFSNRQGDAPLSFSADELAQALRAGRATLVPLPPIFGRALNNAMDGTMTGMRAH